MNCSWSVWSNWTSCSSTCGEGHQTRTRDYATLAQYGGSECVGGKNETQICPNNPNCPGTEIAKYLETSIVKRETNKRSSSIHE